MKTIEVFAIAVLLVALTTVSTLADEIEAPPTVAEMKAEFYAKAAEAMPWLKRVPEGELLFILWDTDPYCQTLKAKRPVTTLGEAGDLGICAAIDIEAAERGLRRGV